ncbi:MAG: MCP four helix bundle domain-containing protein [Comamonadaceae bacterium]|nr:MCP four helix bundle domain-containing protein [Comamonadaceae bacterium]
MRVLGRLSIRARLYFGTVFSLALLVLLGGMGYVSLDRTRTTLQVLFAERVQTLTDMSDLRTTLGDLRRAEKDIIINYNNAVEVGQLRERWNKSLASLRKSLGEARGAQAADAAFAKAVDQALAEIQQYAEGIGPIFDRLENAQLDGAGAGAYADQLKQHMEATDQLLSTLAQSARQQMDEARQAVDARTSAMAGLIGVTLLVALAVLVPLTLASVRSITRSLAQARDLAEHIAAGDLTHEIRAQQQDEVGQLVQAMGRMQEALRALVRQVQDAAGNIATASGEIATGNQDLSLRTEQTAASLQETASSMELLAGTVQSGAESSRHASDYAVSAAQVAQRGGSMVEQVVQTMDQITASSRKIADITGVIDSIAFQTNILALNAAVEAARAGEQGRGFAVVAGEVRILAQRSAAAAREIKDLIGNSSQRVEEGSRQVAQAGQTMTEIVGSVRRVSDIIGEVTAAAADQRDNLGQIHQSVRQLDQMTQQNAALVEQSAAASESLREQARLLAQAVRQFKVREGEGAAGQTVVRVEAPAASPMLARALPAASA